MEKLKNRIGMTLAEMLIVIAIISVMSGVSFVAVYNHQRSLGQLERDGIAKEIFVAAQNHLTAACGSGYWGTSEFGTAEGDDTGVYYYAVSGSINEDSALGQMLPFGSIDETVRAGGSYIIRYQKDTGTVLDVFYCTRSGSPERYNHTLADSDYEEVLDLKGEENKTARKDWNDSILGWYGGVEAATLPTLELEPPEIAVTNAEKLYVTVEDTNSGKEGAMLKLILEGLSSGAKKAISIPGTDSRVAAGTDNSYTVMLDDITASGCHFAELEADTGTFIPGENLAIRAVAYSTSALANIAYSDISTANSLFGSIHDADADQFLETAGIYNIRHLENLDQKVSNLGKAATAADTELEIFEIGRAVQMSDLDWEEFKSSTNNDSTVIFYSDSASSYSAGSQTTAGYYYPISPEYALTYDGKSLSVSNVQAYSADAGLFGTIAASTVTEISNLELIDFTITGKTSAGALAGTASGTAVTNVLAHNSRDRESSRQTGEVDITASAAAAGGLIGVQTGGSISYSAACLLVSGQTAAGGLVGIADGTVAIAGCYSSGHTASGSYEERVDSDGHSYDVTGAASGAVAGGLVGNMTGSSSSIADSYSTCSVSGTNAGGFAGNAAGTISNCYAAGYIDPNASSGYAFLCSGDASLTGNYYYRIINEDSDTNEPMLPVSDYELTSAYMAEIQPLDLNAGTCNTFVGEWSSWNPAMAFDPVLIQYYSGRYTLKTVDELNSSLPTDYDSWDELFVYTHYGDWPAPEVFFINVSE